MRGYRGLFVGTIGGIILVFVIHFVVTNTNALLVIRDLAEEGLTPQTVQAAIGDIHLNAECAVRQNLGQRANVRVAAGLDSTVIASLDPGTPLFHYWIYEYVDGMFWVQIVHEGGVAYIWVASTTGCGLR